MKNKLTPSQKLTTVLEYVVRKGYGEKEENETEIIVSEDGSYVEIYFNMPGLRTWIKGSLNDIIYDHNFAKAVYGEKEIEWEVECEPLDGQYSVFEPMHSPAWMHHLQNQVLSPDPIDYLYQFMKEQV